jgi:hypothetical protein
MGARELSVHRAKVVISSNDFFFHQLKRKCHKRVPSVNKVDVHANERANTRKMGPLSDGLCVPREPKKSRERSYRRLTIGVGV